jgi:peptidoglycan/LPS O-acetylase OafA/YrhL
VSAWFGLLLIGAAAVLLLGVWLLAAYMRWRRRWQRLRWERRQAWLERQAARDRRDRLGLEDNL